MYKIALVNNMNNNFFSLYRYFEETGCLVDLYVMEGGDFHPSADTFRPIASFNILELDLLARPVKWYKWKFKQAKLKRIFKKYDCIIACGASVAYLNRAKIKTNVVVPSGGDLYEYASYEHKGYRGFMRVLWWFVGVGFWYNFVYHQRKGLEKADAVVTNPNHALYKSKERKLPPMNMFNWPIPMIYHKEIYVSQDNVWRFLENHDFVVFNHSRQYWKTNYNNYLNTDSCGVGKRNDKVIEAFAQFIQKTQFKSPILILFEYGIDINESKALISALEIEPYVRWMPKMERKHIMQGLSCANFGVDQLREGICGIGGTSQEVLASGVPLITHTNGETSDPQSIYYKAPIVDVLSVSQIISVFEEYEENPEKFIELKRQITTWYSEKFGLSAFKRYKELVDKVCR